MRSNGFITRSDLRMELTPLLLSRLQFAFTISVHIIFPTFTIGIAAWLSVLEALRMATRKPVYARLFQFWLRIFAVGFGLGVVTGVVMAFQFGTNWSVLARSSGAIQGPLLAYESFTAFALEAAFFGVLLFGRDRVPPWMYLFSVLMVALGTSLSAFWIMVNNSWMQVPVGHAIQDGTFVAADWWSIVFSPVQWVRFPHMLLAGYIAGAFSVAATGAWYMLRSSFLAEARVMLRMGLVLAAVLLPVQMLFGHLTGDYIHRWQPAKFAAIEARWHDEQPASEVLFAIPDEAAESNRFEISIPVLGSVIASGSLSSKEVGLTSFAPEDRPPVAIPFFTFRLMVGCGLVLMLAAWVGSWLTLSSRMESSRGGLWLIVCCFPLPFIATLAGWYTAEVGRQPWVVYGLLRTAEAVTPTLSMQEAAVSLAAFILIYALICGAGAIYLYRSLRAGPSAQIPSNGGPRLGMRPMATAIGASNRNDRGPE